MQIHNRNYWVHTFHSVFLKSVLVISFDEQKNLCSWIAAAAERCLLKSPALSYMLLNQFQFRAIQPQAQSKAKETGVFKVHFPVEYRPGPGKPRGLPNIPNTLQNQQENPYFGTFPFCLPLFYFFPDVFVSCSVQMMPQLCQSEVPISPSDTLGMN